MLEGFCDANWVFDNDEVSSNSGCVFSLGGGAISSKSAKQTYTARSTMEVEFIAFEWPSLLADMPLSGRQHKTISLYYYLQAVIEVAQNSVYNGKKRHIYIRHSAVKQLLKHNVISLENVRSEKNLADPLIKGFSKRVILETSNRMGLKPVDWDSMVEALLWSNETILFLTRTTFSVTCGSGYERLSLLCS